MYLDFLWFLVFHGFNFPMSTGVLLAVGVCAGAHCGLSQNKKARRVMPWINLLYRLLTISENFYLLNLEVIRGSKPVFLVYLWKIT